MISWSIKVFQAQNSNRIGASIGMVIYTHGAKIRIWNFLRLMKSVVMYFLNRW